MILPSQSRAARGLLQWSQSDLADAAKVSLSTVRDFEVSKRSPMPNNLAAIHAAFEAAGVIFIAENGEGPGVRLRKAGPLTFRQFLQQAVKTNDPVGDFIGDARMDRNMPDVADWPELRAYLEGQGAIPAAIDAGEAAWDRFITERDATAKR